MAHDGCATTGYEKVARRWEIVDASANRRGADCSPGDYPYDAVKGEFYSSLILLVL